jgi:hypothetical protein
MKSNRSGAHVAHGQSSGGGERLRFARFIHVVAAGAVLTGCATTRYVETPCLTRAQLEQLKAQEPGKIHSQLNGDAAHDVGPLAGSAIRLRAYANGLLVVLGGCINPNEGTRSK